MTTDHVLTYAYRRYVNDTDTHPLFTNYQADDRLVLAYTGTVDVHIDAPYRSMLERIFDLHNADDRPDGRLAPSMSVGDVVEVRLDTPLAWVSAYACQEYGWQAVARPLNIDNRFWIEVQK